MIPNEKQENSGMTWQGRQCGEGEEKENKNKEVERAYYICTDTL